MKARFLTISGESIKKRERYYKVSATSPFDLTVHQAGVEKNTYGYCYFKNENEAFHYQRLCRLSKLINHDIKNIENKHHRK